MYAMTAFITASFTSPENIGTTPQSLLWLLPLVLAIAVVYKAMKLPTISVGYFIKEVVMLFGSIIIFIAIIAFALYAVARLITE
jgi:hypothetical protein